MSEIDCAECQGTGVAERISGHDRPCDVCHGEGTRPQPSAGPVAWMYVRKRSGAVVFHRTRRSSLVERRVGWTETPLYPASALEAARRDALEEAAALIETLRPRPIAYDAVAKVIRALKDQAKIQENSRAD